MKLQSFLAEAWGHKVRSLFILAAIVTAGLVIGNMLAPEKVAEKAKTSTTNLVEYINADGSIQVKENANLYFAAPTKVAWVGVKKGDKVRKYQVLATLDKKALEENRRKALLNYQTARWNFEQIQDDYDINGRKIDEVPNLSDADKRKLQQAQFDLDKAVSEVNSATIAMENYAIVSPIDGIVTEDSNLRSGDLITTADLTTRFIRVVNPKSVYFRAEIDEVDFGKIKENQEVIVTLDAFGDKEYKGVVKFIASEAVKNTSGSVKVYTDIPLDDIEGIVPNLNGEARIKTSQKENVLVLPKKFVTFKNGKAQVNVQSGKKITTKEIKTGMVTSSEIEITEGLNEGDEVVRK